jgi:hypothetical protein
MRTAFAVDVCVPKVCVMARGVDDHVKESGANRVQQHQLAEKKLSSAQCLAFSVQSLLKK